jgi:hypothetical protein
MLVSVAIQTLCPVDSENPLNRHHIFDHFCGQTMDRLPKVLQNEIWEYVRGDRAHWKDNFTKTIKDTRLDGSFRYFRVKFVHQGVDVRVILREDGTRNIVGRETGYSHWIRWHGDFRIPDDKVDRAVKFCIERFQKRSSS